MRRAEARSRWRPLALLLALGLVAYGVLVHWWWTAPMLALGDRIQAVRDEELALRMEAQQAAEIEARLARLQAAETADPGFLAEPERELATAALVNRLEAEVRRAASHPMACEILSRTPLDVPVRGPFARATVQVRLRCEAGVLAQLLHALEGGRPALFVDNLALGSLATFFGAGQVALDGRIDVTFDLYGYLRPVAPVRAREAADA